MATDLQRKLQVCHGTTKMRRKTIQSRGFSLLELLIVVAVVLVLAAITIPHLLRSRIAANEASAANAIRQISMAEVSYSSTYSAVGFAPDLATLGSPVGPCTADVTHACILDSVISSGGKDGYTFFAAGFAAGGGSVNTAFVASSAPQNFNKSGVRMFCAATDAGTLRVKQGSPGATPAPDVVTCMSYPNL